MTIRQREKDNEPYYALAVNGVAVAGTSPERFDAVLSDSIHPACAGNGSLYSLEYFRLIRDRLEPGGIASMWLPTYSLTPDNFGAILKAFSEVFPHVAVWYEPSTRNAFTIVTGKIEDPVWDPEQLARAFSHPQIRDDLASLDIKGPADLLAMLIATEADLAPWLNDIPSHTDDRPRVEYQSGRLLDRNETWLQNFPILLDLRPSAPAAEYMAALSSEEQERATVLYEERAGVLKFHQQLLAERLAALSRQALP